MMTVQKALLAAAVGLLGASVAHAQTQADPAGNPTTTPSQTQRPTTPPSGVTTTESDAPRSPTQTRRARDTQGTTTSPANSPSGATTSPGNAPAGATTPKAPAGTTTSPANTPSGATTSPASGGQKGASTGSTRSEDMETQGPSASAQGATGMAGEVSLSVAQRQKLQERLARDGHYDGEIDGIIGNGTRSALRAFQRDNKLAATGRMTQETLDAMAIEVTGESEKTAATSPSGASRTGETATGDAASTRSGSTAATDTDTTGSEGTATTGTRASGIGPQNTVQLAAVGEAPTRAIQRKLQALGYYEGEIDGVAGPATRRALRAFYQAQADLVVQGKLWADSASVFDLNASDVEPVRGQGEAERERGQGEAVRKMADDVDTP
jgi:peptidoglycan hydrolase-like protein with peptidoglycan-binding domain